MAMPKLCNNIVYFNVLLLLMCSIHMRYLLYVCDMYLKNIIILILIAQLITTLDMWIVLVWQMKTVIFSLICNWYSLTDPWESYICNRIPIRCIASPSAVSQWEGGGAYNQGTCLFVTLQVVAGQHGVITYGYKNPHYKPKTVWRPSQVYNGNPYTDKTASS